MRFIRDHDLRRLLRAGLPAMLVTSIACAAAAEAANSPAAQALIDAHVAATGGRAAFDAERTVYTKGRIRSMGMTGTFEQWVQRPNRLLLKMSLGPIRTRTGYDGHTGWRTDLNSKKVTMLDGKELEALASDAWFENEAWVTAGARGAAFSPGNTSFRGGESYRSLDITPPAGPSRRLWFDTRSGLIDRIVRRRDQQEWEQWVRGWRAAGGRKHWTLQSSTNPSDPEARRDPDVARWEERMTVDSIRVNVPLDSGFFSPPRLGPAPVAWISARGKVAVPFRYGTRHVWIKASINGGLPGDFLLDTGCSITAIDRDYAERMGLAAHGALAVQGVSGTGQGSFARLGSIRITGPAGAGVAVRDLKVALVDLGEDFDAVMWRKTAGLIGYDVLSRFVVEIDYDREVVTFHDPATFAYSGSAEPIPMRLCDGIPTVQVTLNDGCSGEFIVDAGNSFGLDVHGSMVRRCQMLPAVSRRKQVEIHSGGIGGSAVNWLTRLDKIRIGSNEWTEPIAGLSLGSRGMMGSTDYSGNIGNGILERFRCTFDYEGRRLYLEPGKRFGERDGYSRSGTFLVKVSDRVYPGQILHGSPAQQAGLDLGDQVTAIDGRPAASFTPEQLDRLFVEGALGSTHTLTVERDGEKKTLTMTLREVL